jgi:hypothetical protein
MAASGVDPATEQHEQQTLQTPSPFPPVSGASGSYSMPSQLELDSMELAGVVAQLGRGPPRRERLKLERRRKELEERVREAK